MTDRRRPEDSTLLDILIDGFEKNEVLGGMHLRRLPLPSAEAGRAVFDRFVAEASTWQGAPTDVRDEGHRAGRSPSRAVHASGPGYTRSTLPLTPLDRSRSCPPRPPTPTTWPRSSPRRARR